MAKWKDTPAPKQTWTPPRDKYELWEQADWDKLEVRHYYDDDQPDFFYSKTPIWRLIGTFDDYKGIIDCLSNTWPSGIPDDYRYKIIDKGEDA